MGVQLAKVTLTQNEPDALVVVVVQYGGLASATLWKKLNAGNKAAVPAELAKWNRAAARIAGLTRRRKAEGLMFAGNVSEALKVARG